MNEKIEMLNLIVLEASPTNPRKSFEPEALQELAASIQANGIISPIVVRALDPGRFEVVAGERRFRAAKIAGHKFVPCVVRKLSDQQVIESQLVENLQRMDLGPVEEAHGFRAALDLRDEKGIAVFKVEDLAVKVGKSADYIYRRLKLLDLPETALKAVEKKVISPSTAEIIGRIPDKRLREKATEEVLDTKTNDRPMTRDETQKLVETHYMRSLTGCDFDPEDVTLRKDGMKCSVCPHRSGNSEFASSGNDKKSGVRADMCMDPVCFEKKAKVAFERWKATQESAGRKVLTPEQNKKLVQGDHIVTWASSMVVLDEPPGAHLLNPAAAGKKIEPWRKLIADRGVEVFVARLANGSALECADRDEATEAAKLNGHKIFRLTNKEDREAYAEQKKQMEEEKKARAAVFVATLKSIPSLKAVRDVLDLAIIALGDLLPMREVVLKVLDQRKLTPADLEDAEACRLALQLVFAAKVDPDYNVSSDGKKLIKLLGFEKKVQKGTKNESKALASSLPARKESEIEYENTLIKARAIRAEDPSKFTVALIQRKLKLGFQAASQLFDKIIQTFSEDILPGSIVEWAEGAPHKIGTVMTVKQYESECGKGCWLDVWNGNSTPVKGPGGFQHVVATEALRLKGGAK